MRAIVLFGSDEQKQRLLPDLAAARKLAAFALTEPEAGSDAASMRTRAVRQPDGSWLLNGEKRYIGNGTKAEVLVTFAGCDVGESQGHIALIVERGMPGFEPGERYDMLGMDGNDVRRLYFKDVRIPPENVLGEPGEGFRIATETLKTGRLSLGAACVGIGKRMRRLSVEHTLARQQFGFPLAAFEMVQEKVAWMAENTFAGDSMVYLTTALVDRGMPDAALETALLKVFTTEFVLEAANKALVLHGGQGYMRSNEFEKTVRDVRIYSIFEGANDVLRAFVSMTGLKASAKLVAAGGPVGRGDPLPVHPALAAQAQALEAQAEQLGATVVGLATAHGPALRQLQIHQRRLADSIVAIYAQACTLSRMTALLEEAEAKNGDGPPVAAQLTVAEGFCAAAGAQVGALLDSVEANDDDRTRAVAQIAYAGGTAADAFQPSDWGLES